MGRAILRMPDATYGIRSIVFLISSLVVTQVAMARPVAADHLCFLPLDAPFAEDDERRAELEGMISSILAKRDFELTNSEQVKTMMDRVEEEFGAIYDPVTGDVLPNKLKRYRDELAIGFRSELGCDARLAVSLVVMRAPFSAGVAHWDGVERSMTSTGRAVLNALGGVYESGWVSALSIWISVQDPEGDPLVFRSAGVEPLVSLSVSRNEDKLPEDQWLRNDTLLLEAIYSALGWHAEHLRLPN